ncbi:Flavin-dependent L-tryptophan oxidase RebO precursor [Pelagimonas phthalicica]|uniref:Tryptophan 2-monooxygenase n=1 Tax=Pelagimonas phthalicica TaxID=1037362 RepID=A0A238JE09_9RHOB|nr:NAD(P)/FAD-dependent oxidoreductase [Pelagimonas phthalicica]TDS91870.1 putative NAD(P)-binding protein [Pelagimonas phthalicica]SMX28920.1 Flavin-dependent L-tryptophan oxidase RebO precursor [Pelagimonas phthalicica]
MDRRTFTFAAASLMCAPHVVSAKPSQHVTIIGAGSAGLTAAYHLTKSGVRVQILEASQSWGGRLKRLSGFADVPLDLGAEWIHDEPEVLGRILGHGETDLGVATINYQPQTYQFWHNGQLNDFNLLRHGYGEVKFFDITWYGFFERFVLPSIREKVIFGAVVSQVSKQGAQTAIRLSDGRTLTTDKVLVTVPLSVLQSAQIAFQDGLAPPDMPALQDIDFGSGFKLFLKFRERFYPDMLFEGSRASVLADTWAEKIYYDAAFGKPTQQNILGLFTVSDQRLRRAKLNNAALLADVLEELTKIFGPVVREAFIDGVVQNWSLERFIMGSYSMDNHGQKDISDILKPVEGRVFFAGEALGEDDQSTVQGAAFSATRAVEQIVAS